MRSYLTMLELVELLSLRNGAMQRLVVWEDAKAMLGTSKGVVYASVERLIDRRLARKNETSGFLELTDAGREAIDRTRKDLEERWT